MFTKEDMRNAKQVVPFISEDDGETTQVRIAISEENVSKRKLVPIAPAVVVLSLALLATPKGAVLEAAKSVINSVKQTCSAQKHSPEPYSVKQGDINIKANNSNVRNVQVTNFGGQVNISAK